MNGFSVCFRCDRAMIYVFIAGSYTPWLTLKNLEPKDGWGVFLRWAIWPFASMGIAYQQLFHEKYKSIETLFYIMIGVLPSLVVYEMVSFGTINSIYSRFLKVIFLGRRRRSIRA